MPELDWFETLAGHGLQSALLREAGRDWQVAEMLEGMRQLLPTLDKVRVLAVLADNGTPWVLADLAAQAAQVVHLPLPAFFSDAQLQHALALAGADLLLTDQPARIEGLRAGFQPAGTWLGLQLMRRDVAAAGLPPGTAKLSFTSGSTGAPKGVCLSVAGLLDTARAVDARLRALPLRSHLAVLPLALLLENVAGVYAPLLRGLPVHLRPLSALGWRGGAGFDPASLDALQRACAASSVILVPELLKAWTLWLQSGALRACSCLQFVAVGGAKVAAQLLRAARGVGLPVAQGYGLTEAGSVVSLNLPDGAIGGVRRQEDDSDETVGLPLAHARVSIDQGEVVVGTRAFLGYAGDVQPAPARFRTGDLGGLDARGRLRLNGRRKNLLISSYGRNISPEWIEALLLADARVLQAVVSGDGRPAPVALLVAAPGVRPAALDHVVQAVNRELPDYARLRAWAGVLPFSPADGTASPNGRPVRARIEARDQTIIDALYQEESTQNEFL